MAKMFTTLVVALALSACNSGGGGGEKVVAPPPPALNLSGDWGGTWLTDDSGGNATTFLTQIGDEVAGAVFIDNSPCFDNGSVHGRVSEERFTGSISFSSPPTRIDFDVDIIEDGTGMLGVFLVVGGDCHGETGDLEFWR